MGNMLAVYKQVRLTRFSKRPEAFYFLSKSTSQLKGKNVNSFEWYVAGLM